MHVHENSCPRATQLGIKNRKSCMTMESEAEELCVKTILKDPRSGTHRRHLGESPRPLCRIRVAALRTMMFVTKMHLVLAADVFRCYMKFVPGFDMALTLVRGIDKPYDPKHSLLSFSRPKEPFVWAARMLQAPRECLRGNTSTIREEENKIKLINKKRGEMTHGIHHLNAERHVVVCWSCWRYRCWCWHCWWLCCYSCCCSVCPPACRADRLRRIQLS